MKHPKVIWRRLGAWLRSASSAAVPEATWEAYKAAGSKAYKQGNYIEAETQFSIALKLAEELGPQDPRLGTSLNNLGMAYKTRGQFGKAELLFRRALRVYKKALGPAHPHVAAVLSNLATLYGSQGNYAEAEPLYKQALAIAEDALGPDHPDVGATLDSYADLLRKTRRYEEATAMEMRAKTIRAKRQ
jgi:tetratricopeptide (TPR) repeat protein